jgi:hypothetical protein
LKVQGIYYETELDPYGENQSGFTRPEFWLDPQERTCGIRQESRRYPILPSIPVEAGLIMHADVSPEITIELDGPAVKRFLNGKVGQTLLGRICDGFRVLWTGHNHIGTINDDARNAWAQLTNEIRARGSEWDVWSAGEWYGNTSAQELGLIGLSNEQVTNLQKNTKKKALITKTAFWESTVISFCSAMDRPFLPCFMLPFYGLWLLNQRRKRIWKKTMKKIAIRKICKKGAGTVQTHLNFAFHP